MRYVYHLMTSREITGSISSVKICNPNLIFKNLGMFYVAETEQWRFLSSLVDQNIIAKHMYIT